MTSEPTNTIPAAVAASTPNPLLDKQITILEDIFSLGYSKSQDIKVYEDSRGVEFIVQYRTLTACELRDIAETLGGYRSLAAQVWTEKIESLARAIVHINKMPLILDLPDRKAFEEKHKQQPSVLEQARIILYEKIKSPHIIDVLFENYQEFVGVVAQSFDDIKKKLKNQPPFKLTED
jgi:hypothetical protein